jgi:circadian clock protein KaiC
MRSDIKDQTSAADQRCASGVSGLDEVLSDGLPSNCFYLIQGDPGSGKTTLALQFLLEGVRRGEKTLYITLSETKEELLKVARSHGWSLEAIPLFELSAIESLVRPDAHTTVFHPSELELTKVSSLLMEEIRKTQPARIVFDSLSEFRLMAETALRYRRQLLNLKQEFAKYHSTVLLLDDKMDNSRIGADPHVLSLTHGVIELEQLSPDYGRSRRRLRVLKLRGVRFREGYHDYSIEKGGLRVFPRIVAAEHRAEFSHEPVSSGHPDLDALLGGGLDRGTTTLIMGAAGTGKSTLAMQYAAQMAGRGESGLLFAFDEVRDIVLARATALGLDFERHVESGLINVQQVDPAELSPGEFGMRVRLGVETGCKLVIIDSLNGYMNAMPGEKYLTNQLHELAAYLNQRGVVTIFILALHGLVGPAEAPVDLSYLADTVMSVRYFEAGGAVKQALSVIKKRSGHHEKTIREFRLESGLGLRIGPPLTQFHGVLTGAPIFHGGKEQIMGLTDAGR